jgi:hypothetical protein
MCIYFRHQWSALRVQDKISRRGERINQERRKKKERRKSDKPKCQCVVSLFMSSNAAKQKNRIILFFFSNQV